MTRSLHLQIRILAMLLFAVAIIRPMGFVQTHDALASPTAAPTVLYFVYDFVVYGLCAWGLLRRQVWARWIAIVLTSRIAIANIARLPLEANESALPPPLDSWMQWAQWGGLVTALVFGYFTWLLWAKAGALLDGGGPEHPQST